MSKAQTVVEKKTIRYKMEDTTMYAPKVFVHEEAGSHPKVEIKSAFSNNHFDVKHVPELINILLDVWSDFKEE